MNVIIKGWKYLSKLTQPDIIPGGICFAWSKCMSSFWKKHVCLSFVGWFVTSEIQSDKTHHLKSECAKPLAHLWFICCKDWENDGYLYVCSSTCAFLSLILIYVVSPHLK